MSPARAASAAFAAGGNQRLIHDLPNRTRTTPAFRVTAEAAIDLVGSAGRSFAAQERVAHVVVGKHVARTDDHDPAGRAIAAMNEG